VLNISEKFQNSKYPSVFYVKNKMGVSVFLLSVFKSKYQQLINTGKPKK